MSKGKQLHLSMQFMELSTFAAKCIVYILSYIILWLYDVAA